MQRVLLLLSLLPACTDPPGADAPTIASTGDASSSTTDVVSTTATTTTAAATDPDSTGPDDSSTTEDPTTTSSSTGEPDDGPMRIGLVQYDADAHFGDWDFNTASLTMWAEAAIEQGADVLVFPEGSSYGYASPTELWCSPGMDAYEGRSCRDVSTVAEPLPGGPTTDYWATFAADHGVAVIYHVPEVDGAQYYNAIGVVGPTGFVTKYRKRTLYYVDQAYASEGDTGTVISLPDGDFGLMICLDATYDGPYYDEYLAQGVDGIILPMDWDDDPDGPAAAIDWFRDRAAANGVSIFAADVSTWDGTAHYPPGDVPRERNGLPEIAIGIDGISVHDLAAP